MAEQRYRAVLEVAAGVPVTEVAERSGVNVQRPERASARTNDVEVRKARRRLGRAGRAPAMNR